MRSICHALLPVLLALFLQACGGGGGGGGGSPAAPSGLTYGTANPTYEACLAIAPNSPAVTGQVDSYSVDPALPPGLVLDVDTGVISGTPSALAAAATHTVTATGPGGSAEVDLVIGVVEPDAPAGLTYGSPELEALVDVNVDLEPTLAEGVPSLWSASPALPAGLALDPATGAISGAASATLAPTVHTISVEDCLGRSTSFDLTISAVDTADLVIPRFLHAVAADGTLSTYGVTTTGQLRPLGYDLVAAAPVDVAASWTRRHVLVLGSTPPSLESWEIDGADGRLDQTPEETVALPAGSAPARLLVDETRRVVYVSLAGANSVAAFELGGDGSLTALAGSPFPVAGAGPTGLALSPDGGRLLVANATSGTINVFLLDGTGNLGAQTSNAITSAAANLAVLQGTSDTFVYTAEDNLDAIGVYALVGSALVVQSSVALPVNSAPIELVARDFAGTPALYALSQDPNANLRRFAPNPSTGALGGAFNASSGGPEGEPSGFAVASDGSFAFTHFGTVNEWASFSVGAGGALTAVAPASAPTNRMRTRPGSGRFVLTHGAEFFSRTSDAVYTANRSVGDLNQYSLDSGVPALDALVPATVGSAGAPNWVVVHPRLEQLYVAQDLFGNAHLRRFALAEDRTASEIDTLDLAVPFAGLFGLDMDPSGRFLFGSARGHVRLHSIAVAADGAMTAADDALTADFPLGVGVAPHGAFVYVANTLSDSISGFAVDPTSGALTPVPGSPFATQTAPFGVTVDATGRYLYAPNRGSDTISAYSIDPATGQLFELLASSPIDSGPIATGEDPEFIAADPFGRAVVVVCAGISAPALRVHRINLDFLNLVENGSLSQVQTIALAGVPVHAAFDGTGTRLFVTLTGAGEVQTFTYSPVTGISATPVDVDAAGSGARTSAARSRP